MIRRTLVTLVALSALLFAPATAALAEQGVLNGDEYTFTDRRGNTVTVPVNSFASYVVDFQHGDPWMSDELHTDPQIAIGLPDYVSFGSNSTGDLCMGKNGILTVGFDTAIYDGPGDDVYVFEVGGFVEETRVELSDDLATWYEIGVVEGSTAGLDIAGKVPAGSGFRYVRLSDTGNNPDGDWPGADIDAICGLNIRELPDEPAAAPSSLPSLFSRQPGSVGDVTTPSGRAFDDRLDLTGTWQGFYLGMNDGVGIVRHIRVGITECSGSSFSGTLFFETPTDPEMTGEYRLEGTVDEQGNVHWQGTGEWVVYREDFDQIPFDGRLCECGDTINGIVNNDANRAFFVERLGEVDFGTTGTSSGTYGDDGIEGTIDDYPIVWSNYNIDGVYNGAEYAPAITVDQTVRVMSINTYHWNGGQGVLPGEIALVDHTDEANPVVLGQWEATPRDGYLGAPNVYWDVFCDVTLEPGHTYVVYDSDWQTWSYNDGSDGEGFVELRGYPDVANG